MPGPLDQHVQTPPAPECAQRQQQSAIYPTYLFEHYGKREHTAPDRRARHPQNAPTKRTRTNFTEVAFTTGCFVIIFCLLDQLGRLLTSNAAHELG